MPANNNHDTLLTDNRLLQLLAQNFPNISAAAAEIINLEAILNLPKGTEHFVADLHGEHEAFSHILRNASGNIRRKVSELFAASMRDQELRDLCTLIYYPDQKLEQLKAAETTDINDFYSVTLFRLIRVLQSVSSKYTRSKVRKALPADFAYIIQELLHESPSDDDKDAYFRRIIETIISTGQADQFIIAIANVIQRLSIDRLHILGDIYDRGPGAHIIMDTLCDYDKFDIQWGNHDALWMGAFAGNEACMANVLRLSLRYNNLLTLEDGYGISLLPLATFAMETYADDPCTAFRPVVADDIKTPDAKTLELMARMHKAITVIQFKLEGHIIDRRPEWGMADRKVLTGISHDLTTVTLDGHTYPLTDTYLPTVDPDNPYRLTPDEASLVDRLRHSFQVSDRLQRHIQCLLSHGGLYRIVNSNLLFHASIPLNADGTLKQVQLMPGYTYSGRELMNHISSLMRAAFNDDTPADIRQYARDYYWYLWCGPDSVLFDKSKMATFERYFIADTDTHTEVKGHYYRLRNDQSVCDAILDAFSVTGSHRHIINGHVPVRINKGESPIRAQGRLLVIDGGFAKAYHKKTGIAGYTLVYHSRGLQLVQHEPFASTQQAITDGTDIASTTQLVELSTKRMRVRDTDKGRTLQAQIDELTQLLYAFRHGLVMQQHTPTR